MKTLSISILIVLLLLKSQEVISQDSDRQIHHSISIKSKFTQNKDEFNYGLVYNGFNPGFEYSIVSGTVKNIIIYRAEFDFGANFKKGLGIAWSLKPVDLFYGFRVNRNPEIPVTLGPYIAGNYKWLLFPFLQSGKMFWISSWELGPRIMVSLPYKEKTISLSLANSVAGFISRPVMKTEEYFYSLSLSDFVRNPHSNMTFGLQNVFNHTSLNVELTGQSKKRSLSYEFEFMGYMKEPMFRYLSHSINLKWKIRNKKIK